MKQAIRTSSSSHSIAGPIPVTYRMVSSSEAIAAPRFSMCPPGSFLGLPSILPASLP